MNRIKGSVIAKLAAWAILLVSGVCFIGSCILVAVMEDYQIFEMPQKDVLEREFAEVNDCYSVAAIKNAHRGSKEDNEKYFANKAFRYGIIESESLEGLDLNSEDTYLEKNFITGNTREEELYLFFMRVSQENDIWYSDELFGSWGYWTYQDEYYTLHILPKSDAKDYLVVSFVDKSALEAEKQAFLGGLEENSWEEKLEAVFFAKGADLYVLKEVFIDTLYELKADIFAFMFGMLFMVVISFLFLICAAGHRSRKEEIVPAFLDKLPLDILFGAICFMELCGIGIVAFLMNENTSAVLMIPLGIGIGGILASLLVLTVLSFAVRVKLGKWWRNSVIYCFFAKLMGLCRKIWKNIGIFWKAMIIPVIFCVIEIFFGFCAAGAEAWVVLLAVFFNGLLGMIFFIMAIQFYKLQEGSRMIAEGNLRHKIDTTRMFWEFKKHADNLNRIGDGMSHAVDERMKSERFKTELITNVSHDIKTPLTSIINYVDLLERTDVSDETAKEYLEVLERQSARLKKLIEDLIEASKASTGNLSVNMEKLEANVFLTQILGEFEGKIANAGLELIINKPQEEIPILADGRHLWRIVDNLMNNICKYAQPCSRVYINLEQTSDKTLLTFKNMSKYALNITSDELMERFVRGDSSRNTEGNGLGLSIAKSLMELMDGKLLLYIDGDLFKVVLEFSQKA